MVSSIINYGIFLMACLASATPLNATSKDDPDHFQPYSDPYNMIKASSSAFSTSVAPHATSPHPHGASSSSAVPRSGTQPRDSSSGCMRGIPYAEVKYTTAFLGKKISWAYNWESTPHGLPHQYEYVPMLWATADVFTSVWQHNVTRAIARGSTHLLAFNEPDNPKQAELTPAEAAKGYKTYLSDMFGGKNIRLGSPAITNGAPPKGLTWLSAFMTACHGCQIDFVAIHWYDKATNINYFKSYVERVHKQTSKPVWITEFGVTGSDGQINTFLSTVLPWLDTQPYVERVAYFLATDGVLNNGTGLSNYGRTYATV